MESSNRRACQAATFLIFLLMTGLMSCSDKDKLPMWMKGTWKVQSQDYSIEESWKEKGDQLVGKTLWTGELKSWEEKLTITLNDRNELVYTTLIEGKATCFICSDTEADTLVFVNEENDFPKRLHYARPVGNSMEVWIDNIDNDPNRINFHFKRVN